MANRPSSDYPDIGTLGEDLVTQWLESTGWLILHRRWHSRWGEIDIIAEKEDDSGTVVLVFVEVKTRSTGNWDAGGRMAIAQEKQVKLSRTAAMFLATFPEKADYPCRFDVAIVCCQRKITKINTIASLSTSGLYLMLQEYIPAAFEYLIDN
ncbi:MAG: YraN family protein [Cyanobacteria bacterium P01_D01_bin.116]